MNKLHLALPILLFSLSTALIGMKAPLVTIQVAADGQTRVVEKKLVERCTTFRNSKLLDTEKENYILPDSIKGSDFDLFNLHLISFHTNGNLFSARLASRTEDQLVRLAKVADYLEHEELMNIFLGKIYRSFNQSPRLRDYFERGQILRDPAAQRTLVTLQNLYQGLCQQFKNSHDYTYWLLCAQRLPELIGSTQKGPIKILASQLAHQPSGQLITAHGKEIQIWNINYISGRAVDIKVRTTRFALSPKGTYFAYTSKDFDRQNFIEILQKNGDTYQPTTTLGLATHGNCISWCNDETKFIIIEKNGNTMVWDMQADDGEFLPKNIEVNNTTACWSSDSAHYYIGTDKGTIDVYDSQTHKSIQTIQAHTACISTIQPITKTKNILSCSIDGTAKIWNLETGTCTATLTGHSKSITSAAVNCLGNLIATGSEDKTIRIWDVATGTCLQTLTGHSAPVQSVSWHPENPTELCTCDKDGLVIPWNIDNNLKREFNRSATLRQLALLSYAAIRDDRSLDFKHPRIAGAIKGMPPTVKNAVLARIKQSNQPMPYYPYGKAPAQATPKRSAKQMHGL